MDQSFTAAAEKEAHKKIPEVLQLIHQTSRETLRRLALVIYTSQPDYEARVSSAERGRWTVDFHHAVISRVAALANRALRTDGVPVHVVVVKFNADAYHKWLFSRDIRDQGVITVSAWAEMIAQQDHS